MHSSSTSNIKFLVLATLVVLASSSALAASWPYAVKAAHAQAADLMGEAGSANPAVAATDYKLATWLDPSNPAAYIGLAHSQILSGQAEAALTTLDRAGEGSEASELRLRTLIELGRTNDAADKAAGIANRGHNDTVMLLTAFAYALSGRTADIPTLIPLVSSPEAAQRISRAAGDKLTLATELYTSGLPESSKILLMKLPTSFERNLLLGRILYTRHSKTDLISASSYLETATTLNPSNLESHKLLASIYSDRQLISESAAQTVLVTKLQSGKP